MLRAKLHEIAGKIPRHLPFEDLPSLQIVNGKTHPCESLGKTAPADRFHPDHAIALAVISEQSQLVDDLLEPQEGELHRTLDCDFGSKPFQCQDPVEIPQSVP